MKRKSKKNKKVETKEDFEKEKHFFLNLQLFLQNVSADKNRLNLGGTKFVSADTYFTEQCLDSDLGLDFRFNNLDLK
ncbi:hypothetical protein BpHYR1_053851 [Brachionus plicatilis]|uniref:Uncharacterized protein n=1 Tax=Brachionus plicatilis TaxID=10195 RepID=A0A3M7Q634_BRAPC|nr:hypothetical protein BpHYR1_053851 [Brachionus plicatilis]